MPRSLSGAPRRLAIRCALAFAPAVLLGVYALFPQRILLPYVAIVPWVLLYTDDREPRPSFWWFVPAAWVAWMLEHTVAFRFGWYAGVGMGAVLFVWILPFPILLRALHRATRWPRTVTVPIAWVAVEWLRVTLTVAHFDLFLLGYSQARVLPLVQIADVTGVYGLSFFVAMVNGLVADAIVARREAKVGGPDPARRRRVLRSAAVVGAVAAALVAYGLVRLAQVDGTPGPRLALVQPDVEHSERNTVGVHLAQVVYTDEHVPAGAADLIVWPENAILDNVLRPGMYVPDLARLSREKGALMLVGGMGKDKGEPGRTTNTAYLVDGRGTILGEAGKQILFPWSEKIPGDAFLRRYLPPLWRLQRTLVRMGWGFVPTGVPAGATVLLNLPWRGGVLPFSVLICVENTYPPIPAEAGRLGARFLVNITSESKIAGPIQEQLLRISMLRAVENRIAYARCGNSGVSGMIDPDGRQRALLVGEHGGTIADRGVLLAPVVLSKGGATLYARSHDAFAIACLLLALVLCARGAVSRRGAASLAVVALLGPLLGCGGPPAPGRDAAGARAALERGRRLMAAGSPGRAIAPLAAACAASGPCGEAIPLLSAAFLETKRFEDGDAFYAALAERRPDLRAVALFERGRFLDELAELRAAESVTAEAARLDPEAATFAALGTLRMRMDEPAAAIDAYARALALDPGDPQMRYLHARALWLAGRSADAEREITAFLAEHPEMGAAWAVLGRLRAAAGDDSGSLEAYRRAIQGDPDNVEARLMLARDALAHGRRDEAKHWLAEIWEIDARAEARGRARGR